MPATRSSSRTERTDLGAEQHLKDAVLDELASTSNVAQFVSFSPGAKPSLRFARVHDLADVPDSVEGSIEALLARSVERQVNVRSFRPEQPKSHEFIYGIATVAEAATAIRRLADEGLYTIANETIDIHDGGVSGVVFGGVVEFAPDDTPRAVEKSGTAALPREMGLDLLETVYGFRPELTDDPRIRVEWSIHPIRRGYHASHTVVWEREMFELLNLHVAPTWPNRFSRFLGDKAFGLLVADRVGLRVPRTTVVSRRLPPFTFGQGTGSGESWIRTAPTEPVPGRFTTHHGWLDPFELLNEEDPTGSAIASVLSQEGVDAKFSGVAAEESNGELRIEGVAGYGDEFMLGAESPRALPSEVRADVQQTHEHAARVLGAARFEWVHDGSQVWVVQLHRGSLPGHGLVIHPGTPSREHRFEVSQGLEALRELVGSLEGTDEGVVLVGEAGVTSHLGDVLRRARVPARIEPA